MTTVLDREGRKVRTTRRRTRLPKDRREGRGILRRLIIAVTLFLFLMVIVGVIAVWTAWATTPLPPDVPLSQTTTVTDANGKVLATWNAGENRVPVKIGDVPPVVVQAVTATEDHNYYQHHGVDPRGIARALWVDLRSGSNVQGGSTITQQYVKQVYVGTDRTVWRKFKEAILAVKLDQRESKDEVLERYLNTIYFGRGAYGVQTASRAYFNKDVKQLQLQEASYLAGLIRAPELADAYKHPEVAADRRARTLGSMVRYHAITVEDEQRVNAIALKSYVVEKAPTTTTASSTAKGAQYFLDYVRSTLVKKYGEQMVEGGGLKVKTTLDANLQTKAYDSVYGFLRPGEPSGALVSLDQNGYVKAMVGGRDYSQSQVNLAVGTDGGGSGRQAGSTFKAFELASAVANGACYKDTYPGPASMVVPGWDPVNKKPVTNFGGESFGDIDLIEATVHSVNTVYAQMVMDNKPSNLVQTAKKAGITSKLDPNPSLVLGAAEVSPLEMADAYLTFSQGGVHVSASPILEVKNADNQTLERAQPKRERVMDVGTASVVNEALRQVVQRGTGRSADDGISSKVAVAGKTGTTENNGDAWFVGYTPTISTAVWMGYPEGSSRTMSNVRGIAVTGGTFPAQMFSSYMRTATAGDKGSAFDKPEDCRSTTAPPSTTTSSSSTTSSTQLRTRDSLQEIPAGNNGNGNRNDNGNGRGNGRNREAQNTTSTTETNVLASPPESSNGFTDVTVFDGAVNPLTP